MKTFKVIKKNRKYFEATLNGYKCKILIDAASENLEPGEHTLEVDDISVRSKYGTDLIFKLKASPEQQEEAGICTLRTPFFNKNLVNECHRLGGKWDPEEKAWIFSGLVEEEVEALDDKYNSPLVGMEITALTNLYGSQEPIYLAGFKIATAKGRDSGATLSEGISFIKGEYTSSGSMKNWNTKIAEGSVFRMLVPENCLSDFDPEEVSVKRI